MPEFVPENFWWRNITGPSAMIRDTENALSEGYSLILGVPDFTPWAGKMRSILHEDLSGGDLYITVIDADAECSGGAEDFLLSKYDTGRKYRSRLSTVQEYLLRNNALKNHILWVHNFRDKSQLNDWHNFCTKYPSDSAYSSGLFIIDCGNENLLPSGRMKAVNFPDYAGSYDTRIFASFLLDAEGYARPQYSRIWKDYISSLTAMLCGNDAEIAECMIRTGDFTHQEPYDILESVSENFLCRGNDDGHIISLIQNGNEQAITRKIWTAQVQIFFPMIEIARARILSDTNLAGKIGFALSYMDSRGFPMTQGDGKSILAPEDLDIGGLFHMICKSNLIKQNDMMLNDYVSLLRTFRNCLAHMTPCRVDNVRELLEFEKYYGEK